MLAIDHIVIAAKDPEQAAKDFGHDYQITVTEGGRHANWGTHNWMAYLKNDCYIEWLGIDEEATAAKSDNPLVRLLFRKLAEGQEGPIQFALRTNQMDTMIEYLNKGAISYTGPVPGSRKRPDGSLLEWRMLFPETEGEVLPFVIEWGEAANTPHDPALISDKEINSLSANIKDPSMLSFIYQLDFNNHIAQLENANLKLSDTLDFTLKSI